MITNCNLRNLFQSIQLIAELDPGATGVPAAKLVESGNPKGPEKSPVKLKEGAEIAPH